MEKEPIFETMERLERELVRLLRERGVEDFEAKELLDIWTREQEERVEQSGDYRLEQILLNIRRARLYFEAGYLDEALKSFEAAKTQAWNERMDELYQAILDEIDELE